MDRCWTRRGRHRRKAAHTVCAIASIPGDAERSGHPRQRRRALIARRARRDGRAGRTRASHRPDAGAPSGVGNAFSRATRLLRRSLDLPRHGSAGLKACATGRGLLRSKRDHRIERIHLEHAAGYGASARLGGCGNGSGRRSVA